MGACGNVVRAHRFFTSAYSTNRLTCFIVYTTAILSESLKMEYKHDLPRSSR